MSRHLKTKHKSKSIFVRILALGDKNQMQKEISKLIKEGDYQHNFDVENDDTGDEENNNDKSCSTEKHYLPCEFCKGSYQKRMLWCRQIN